MMKQIICPKCKTDNPEEANFCRHCGHQFKEFSIGVLEKRIRDLKKQNAKLKDERDKYLQWWSKENKSKRFFVFLSVALLLTLSVVAILLVNRNEKYEEINSCFYTASKELEEIKNKISSGIPLVVSSIDIANVSKNGDVETDFGSTIYTSNTMYLKPRIRYCGFIDGNITLKTKWYRPDNSIIKGESSPDGYSQSDSYKITLKDNTLVLRGWGNEQKGVFWKQGEYRIEVWYNDICIKTKTFTVY